MSKRIWLALAVMGLMFIPLLAQSVPFYGGHGGGGNGNGNGNGNGYGNGNGNGSGNGNGIGNGGGGCFVIGSLLTGTPFEFEGTVLVAGFQGDEMVVSTATGNMAVFGLGSLNYWNSLNMTKPVEGDRISGKGYIVNYNGSLRNVLTEVTLNGYLVRLRDENGQPLWRHIGGNWGSVPGNGGGNGNCTDILAGQPFSYEGEVIACSVTAQGMQGNGLELATSAGNISVLGMGPQYYWDQLNLTRPVVGDVITVFGFTVDYNGNAVNILMSLVLADGTTVALRDAQTGIPLWRTQNN